MTETGHDHPLRLVPTPIGNLGDVTSRAIDELSRATLVCCEDTRRTAALLRHLGIDRPPLLVVDEHREEGAVGAVLQAMAEGGRVVLVSDAGTPTVSDPGWRLVRAVIEAGGSIEALPGPAAAVTGLVVSGLPTDRFVFEGFLPRSGAARTRRVGEVAAHPMTTVLYEAPHRLSRTLADLEAACGGDREVVLARELTKMYEEIWRGSLAEARRHLEGRAPRGEYVVVLAGAPPSQVTDDDIVAALERELRGGASRRDASDSVAAHLRVARRRVYELSLRTEE